MMDWTMWMSLSTSVTLVVGKLGLLIYTCFQRPFPGKARIIVGLAVMTALIPLSAFVSIVATSSFGLQQAVVWITVGNGLIQLGYLLALALIVHGGIRHPRDSHTPPAAQVRRARPPVIETGNPY